VPFYAPCPEEILKDIFLRPKEEVKLMSKYILPLTIGSAYASNA
jgi:hypothetical protein